MSAKVGEAEFAMLEERARANGLTLSEWVRDVLLAAPVEPGAEAGSEVVLAELLALRSLFLNLSFRANKSPLTEAELRGLIDRADATKLERARERLQAARAATRCTRLWFTTSPDRCSNTCKRRYPNRGFSRTNSTSRSRRCSSERRA